MLAEPWGSVEPWLKITDICCAVHSSHFRSQSLTEPHKTLPLGTMCNQPVTKTMTAPHLYNASDTDWQSRHDVGAITSPHPKFELSENFLLVQKVLFWNAKSSTEKTPCENLRAKLKFWALIISSAGNLQLSVGRLHFCPPTFKATTPLHWQQQSHVDERLHWQPWAWLYCWWVVNGITSWSLPLAFIDLTAADIRSATNVIYKPPPDSSQTSLSLLSVSFINGQNNLAAHSITAVCSLLALTYYAAVQQEQCNSATALKLRVGTPITPALRKVCTNCGFSMPIVFT